MDNFIGPIPKFTPAEARALAEVIVRDVAEIPDRTSPDGEPDMLFVKEGELFSIVFSRLIEG